MAERIEKYPALAVNGVCFQQILVCLFHCNASDTVWWWVDWASQLAIGLMWIWMDNNLLNFIYPPLLDKLDENFIYTG